MLQPNAPPARGADDTYSLVPELIYSPANPKNRSKTLPASRRLLILSINVTGDSVSNSPAARQAKLYMIPILFQLLNGRFIPPFSVWNLFTVHNQEKVPSFVFERNPLPETGDYEPSIRCTASSSEISAISIP